MQGLIGAMQEPAFRMLIEVGVFLGGKVGRQRTLVGLGGSMGVVVNEGSNCVSNRLVCAEDMSVMVSDVGMAGETAVYTYFSNNPNCVAAESNGRFGYAGFNW